jgi:hypothetical protein
MKENQDRWRDMYAYTRLRLIDGRVVDVEDVSLWWCRMQWPLSEDLYDASALWLPYDSLWWVRTRRLHSNLAGELLQCSSGRIRGLQYMSVVANRE